MSVEPLDTLLAIKAVNLMRGLRPSDRQVAALLIEHYNRKSARCDPSIARLSVLLGLSTRTIIRAVKHLESIGLFKKVRHGSDRSHRNSYAPNWPLFSELRAASDKRLKLAKVSRAAELSPSERHSSHVECDSGVTQTYRTNLHKQTYRDSRESKKGVSPPTALRRSHPVASVASADAALTAAERRWTNDLHRAFASMPTTYGEIIEAITPELRAAATQAELKRQGAGFDYIVRQLKLGDQRCR